MTTQSQPVRVFTERVNPSVARDVLAACSRTDRDYNRLKYIVDHMDEFGQYEIRYTRNNENFYRISANGGLQTMTRGNRERLTYNVLSDIDCVNCHPHIIYQLATANNIPCPMLQDYVQNRDGFVSTIIGSHPGVDRSTIKNFVIRSLNMGDYRKETTDVIPVLDTLNPNFDE